MMVIKTVRIKDGHVIANGKQANRCLDDVPCESVIQAGADLVSSIRNAYEKSPKFRNLEFGESSLTVTYDHQISNKSFLLMCETMCQATDTGFRVLREGKKLKVEFYKPEVNPNRVLSERYGSLKVDSITLSTENKKNYAIVLGEGEGEARFRVRVDLSGGEQIRAIFVDARDILRDYFASLDDRALVDTMMAGVRKSDIRGFETGKLADYLSFRSDDYPFLIDPMPNLYFTRDPFATIGTGVSLHRMHTVTRNRETLFGKFIFQYHPRYEKAPKWYDRGETSSLEGGDILVLSPQVLAVGISQRTQEDSIDKFAHTILSISKTFQKILAFDIPKSRSFMHLDTVFTMVDRDKFTVHPNILHEITVFVMELIDGKIKIQEEQGRLEDILKRHLGLDQVKLIKCGSDSPIDAAREQWSDGSNTLAIAPGEVVVYERNYVTNRVLEENGITIHTIPCSELSRGRGGPRCMSMPFIRDDL